jgi:hypothetical protein
MRLLSLLVLALAGCPSYSTLNLDVSSGGLPLRGAVATAVCGDHDGSAARSDRGGAARLQLVKKRRDRPCAITVAAPAHGTERFEVDRLCDGADCMPIEIELAGGGR